MNIVLISTYELGRQPFGLASPAAWLRKRGHNVACFDLSRQSLDAAAMQSAMLIGVYLPMHTATRLAAELIPTLRKENRSAVICCYGLYAPMNENYLRTLGADFVIGGEFEAELVKLAERIAGGENSNGYRAGSPFSMERLTFEVPDRSGMPGIEKYAHLNIPGGGYRIAGSTEASRGCKHKCRHCPIVPVYQGVFRIVGHDVVMEDIRRQVEAGAQHISFGDPDFFNGIGHARKLMESFHRDFPEVTYDATIKVEHLRKYESHLRELKETGCLFVISAVESVDDEFLIALDKGHTREDFLHVARVFRELDLTLHPTFVPFSPWTTMDGYLELLRVIENEELTENVAAVQLGIRLLIPEGSRMLDLEKVRGIVGAFDRKALAYPWKAGDFRLDELSAEVQGIAAAGESKGASRSALFEQVWKTAHAAAGKDAPPLRKPNGGVREVPHLSEPWYCCAEPTKEQLVSIGGRSGHAPQEQSRGVEGFV